MGVRSAAIVFGICLVWNSLLLGGTYVVAPAGNDGNAGSPSAPWRTLSKANAALNAGDTVLVRAGIYHEQIVPARSGSNGSPIVYRAFPGELVIVDGPDDTNLNIVAVEASWIIIEGFTFHNQDYFDAPWDKEYWVVLGGTHNVFRYNRLIAGGDVYQNIFVRKALSRGIAESGQHNTIEHCFVRGLDFGIVLAGPSPRYTILRFDTVYATGANNINVCAAAEGTTAYHGTLIEHCVLDTSLTEDNIQFEPDYADPTSTLHNRGTIIRSCVMGNAAENAIDLKGAGHTMIESNLIYSSSGDDDGPIGGNDVGSGGGVTANANTPTRNTILRRNVIWDHATGIDMAEGDHYYNNTLLNNRRTWQGPNQTGSSHAALRAYNYPNTNRAFLNNIIAGQPNGGIYDWQMDWGGRFHLDNNLYYDVGAPVRFRHRKDGAMITTVGLASWKSELATYGGYAYMQGKDGSAIEADPSFLNAPIYAVGYDRLWDFGLTSTSPAIDAGRPVTSATAGGTASTNLSVQDAFFFSDGFGITGGDTIRISSEPSVRVVAIDYDRNTLTLGEPRTWAPGAGVHLAYAGNAPDIGARETGMSGPGTPDPPQLPPGAVQLSTPVDGARDVALQSSLVWLPVATATSYHVQVSRTSSFGDTAIEEAGLAGTSVPVASLARGTSYYWRVRGVNRGGSGPWSSVWSFTTANPDTGSIDPPQPPPGVIQLSAPADGARNVPLPSSLAWAAAPSAVTYHLQVSATSSFANTVVDADSIAATSQPIALLTSGTTYFWRVRGANRGGFGLWSAIWSFTTAGPDTTTPDPPAQPPGVVQLGTPADGARGVSRQMSLSWSPAPSALLYHVQISLASSFGSRAVDEDSVTGTSFPITSLADSTTYFWRVRAANSAGFGSWSAVRSFATAGGTDGNGKVGSALLLNGDFENGAQGWSYFTNGNGVFSTKTSMSRGSSAAHILIASPGDNTQLYQGGIELGAETYYRLTFSAYSSTGHDVAVGLMKHGPPYTQYGLYNRTVNLDAGWRTHNVYLRTKNFSGTVNDVRLQFWLAGFAAKDDEYWFDDVSIQQIASLPELEKPSHISPAPAATDQPEWVPLSWTRIDGADGYVVQIALDSMFTRLVCDSIVTDTQMVAGPMNSSTCYYRRIRAVHIGGPGPFSQTYSFTTCVAKTGSDRINTVPGQISLGQNYPNPFNPSTVIEYHLPASSHVTLTVYNTLGVEVAVLANDTREAGVHTVSFGASGMASGTYFYSLRVDGQIETRKMLLLR